MDTSYLDPFIETIGRDALIQIQLKKLQLMLGPVLERNAFYKKRLFEAGFKRADDIRTLQDYARLPLTTKGELSADQADHRPHLRRTDFRTPMCVGICHISVPNLATYHGHAAPWIR